MRRFWSRMASLNAAWTVSEMTSERTCGPYCWATIFIGTLPGRKPGTLTFFASSREPLRDLAFDRGERHGDVQAPLELAEGFQVRLHVRRILARLPMVRKGGLEPPWAAPLEPKSSASTNSATFAAAFAERAVAETRCGRRGRSRGCVVAKVGAVPCGRWPGKRRSGKSRFRQTRKYSESRLAGQRADRPALRLPSARCLPPATDLAVGRATPHHPTPRAAGHYENFPVASLLLPRETRAAVLAIYRFARAADDARRRRRRGARGAAGRARPRTARRSTRSAPARPRPNRRSPSSPRRSARTRCRSAVPRPAVGVPPGRAHDAATRPSSSSPITRADRRTRSAACCCTSIVPTPRQNLAAPTRSAPRCNS